MSSKNLKKILKKSICHLILGYESNFQNFNSNIQFLSHSSVDTFIFLSSQFFLQLFAIPFSRHYAEKAIVLAK